MSNNTPDATESFWLPPNRGVEPGGQVEIWAKITEIDIKLEANILPRSADADATPRHHGFMASSFLTMAEATAAAVIVVVLNLLLVLQISGVRLSAFAAVG
jgi:hypothetical protein